jgi:hypothetical protein
MDILFLILLIGMLMVFGYAQLQKNVVRNPGRMITMPKEDE